MELYAAMVENLDHHVGRLIAYLKENEFYANTLIVFISDNGAAGNDFYYHTGPPAVVDYIREHYDNSYENMGRPGSWVSYGPPWAAYPADGTVRPMRGESMLPLLSGAAPSVHDEDYTTTLYHWGRAFLRQGRWKLVSLDPPFRSSRFELFDLETDPGETPDLSDAEPEIYRRMLELWRERRRALGIVLPGDL